MKRDGLDEKHKKAERERLERTQGELGEFMDKMDRKELARFNQDSKQTVKNIRQACNLQTGEQWETIRQWKIELRKVEEGIRTEEEIFWLEEVAELHKEGYMSEDSAAGIGQLVKNRGKTERNEDKARQEQGWETPGKAHKPTHIFAVVNGRTAEYEVGEKTTLQDVANQIQDQFGFKAGTMRTKYMVDWKATTRWSMGLKNGDTIHFTTPLIGGMDWDSDEDARPTPPSDPYGQLGPDPGQAEQKQHDEFSARLRGEQTALPQ
jgi:hypothetical protein